MIIQQGSSQQHFSWPRTLCAFLVVATVRLIQGRRRHGYKGRHIPHVLHKTGPFDCLDDVPQILQKSIAMSLASLEAGTGTSFRCNFNSDMDCQRFIATKFSGQVAKAYDMLLPSAYRADLWRLAVLYEEGGYYSDIGQRIMLPAMTVRDKRCGDRDPDLFVVADSPMRGVQLSFIACRPRLPFIRFALEHMAEQVLRRELGRNHLDITGPCALLRHFLAFFFDCNCVNGEEGETSFMQAQQAARRGRLPRGVFCARGTVVCCIYEQSGPRAIRDSRTGERVIATKYPDPKTYNRLVYDDDDGNQRPHYSEMWKSGKDSVFDIDI